ncbi:ATP synthase F1 subunit gamma [Candidatus Chlorohelix sp.]|uniref:ATP synthase F1 subunit gamma n=1 Tax=Candidatus Chlorohelix sp. TaxID=3139201 RepID=UPI00305BA246
MPSVRVIKRRIRSVSNTGQITKAMELVAASRMRRAQMNVLSSRPFSKKVLEVIADIAGISDKDFRNISPLLQQRELKTVGLVLITTDKGLAGSLNTNALRRATRFLASETGGKPVKIITIGRKGRDFMVRVGKDIIAEFDNIRANPDLLDILPIARVVIDEFTKGTVDVVYLLYTDFINTLTVRPKLIKLLPIEPDMSVEEAGFKKIDFIFEPDPNGVLLSLLPRYVEVEIYQAILENIASEQSSKMVAMRNATDKAKELKADLTLLMNKTRQAQITGEILEIASAAVALEKQK